MKKSLFVSIMSSLLIGFFSGSVFATGQWTNGNQIVSAVMDKPDCKGFYVTAATYQNPTTFTPVEVNLYEFSSTMSTDDIRWLMSLLTTAMKNGYRIHVWLDGTCTNRGLSFTGIQINNP
jgi:hypothetical protein